jgi:hypothetical protein
MTQPRATLATLLAAACAFGAHATPYEWRGSVSNLWSNAANWNPVAVPQSGDTLVFPGTSPTTSVNDLSPGTVLDIYGTPGLQLSGNQIVSARVWDVYRMSAPLALPGNGTYKISVSEAAIDVGAHTLAFATALVNGALIGTGHVTLDDALGDNRVRVNGVHSFTGTLLAPLNLDLGNATLPASLVVDTLEGSGTVGAVQVRVRIQGSFNTGNLKMDPTAFYHVVSNGPTATVTGTVDVTGSILETSSRPTGLGTVAVLLRNDGNDPVIGTFRGLPEGVVLDEINGDRTRLSYVGGDGNDVTRTVISVAKLWTGAGENNLFSNGANWQGGVAPVNGDTIRFEGASANGVKVNDIPGLSLTSIIAPFATFTSQTILSGLPLTITGYVLNARMDLRVIAAADINLQTRVFGGVDVNGHTVRALRLYGSSTSAANGASGTGRIDMGLGAEITGLHAFSGSVHVGEVTGLYLSGEMPAASFTVLNAPMNGSGVVGPLAITGGMLSPRPFFDTGSLTLGAGSTLSVESMDETLNVTGTVTLASPALTLQPGRFLVGRPYVAIRNDGSDAIAGAFAGLPEGALQRTADNRFDFRVSYVGGDGNEVTLTAVNGLAYRNDHDRDGKADIVWQHRGGNGNQALGFVHRMSMDGLAIARQDTVYGEPNLDWRIVGQADFDANGVTDLLWRNFANGHVYVMLFGANGWPTGGAVVHVEPDPAWKIVGVPDIDGDGRADIVWWRGQPGGPLHLQLIDGASVRWQGPAGNAPSDALEVSAHGNYVGGTADELVWRTTDGSVKIGFFELSIGTWFTRYVSVYREPDLGWKVIGAPALDGGMAGLLWRHESNGAVYGMLFTGGPTSGPRPLVGHHLIHVPESASWVVASTGDYDGDGKDDIAWHNEADGRVHVMLMDALVVKDQRTIYREPDTGWKPIGPRSFGAP